MTFKVTMAPQQHHSLSRVAFSRYTLKIQNKHTRGIVAAVVTALIVKFAAPLFKTHSLLPVGLEPPASLSAFMSAGDLHSCFDHLLERTRNLHLAKYVQNVPGPIVVAYVRDSVIDFAADICSCWDFVISAEIDMKTHHCALHIPFVDGVLVCINLSGCSEPNESKP